MPLSPTVMPPIRTFPASGCLLRRPIPSRTIAPPPGPRRTAGLRPRRRAFVAGITLALLPSTLS